MRALTLLARWLLALRAHRVTGLAAEVAFWAVFSLFPALLLAAGLLGTLDTLLGADLADAVEAQVLAALRGVLTERADPLLQAVRGLFRGDSAGLLTTAVLLAVWTVSSGFSTVIDALDVVFGVERRRPWLVQRLLAMLLGAGSVVTLVLVQVMLVVGPLLGGGRRLADALGLGTAYGEAWTWLRAPAALLLVAAWATALFRLAPHRRTRWRTQLPGGALVALLAVGTTLGFRRYLAFALGHNQVLGLLGGGLILMLWFYLLAVVLLLGAELNAALARPIRAEPPQSSSPRRPSQ